MDTNLSASELLLRTKNHTMWSPALRFLYAGVLVIAVLVGASAMLFEKVSPSVYSGPIETVRLGAENGLLTSPIWIAEYKGFFIEQGLNVEIEEFPSGRTALASLLNGGKLDMVTVAQTPVVLNSFTRKDFSVVAGMVTSFNDPKIIARKDRGINTVSDLKGKRIGVTVGSTGHYFLGLFLAQHDLGLGDVDIMDFEASQIVSAITEGKVDAIASWEPHMFNTHKALGENALLFQSDGTFREDFYLVTFSDWGQKNPLLLQRFLRAIDNAETFIVHNPEESKRILSERLQLNEAFISAAWNYYKFALFLDQAALLAFEQQERWMIANKIADKTLPSNYLDFINVEALKAVKPEVVTIIR